jgi:hypothetical protein
MYLADSLKSEQRHQSSPGMRGYRQRASPQPPVTLTAERYEQLPSTYFELGGAEARAKERGETGVSKKEKRRTEKEKQREKQQQKEKEEMSKRRLSSRSRTAQDQEQERKELLRAEKERIIRENESKCAL